MQNSAFHRLHTGIRHQMPSQFHLGERKKRMDKRYKKKQNKIKIIQCNSERERKKERKKIYNISLVFQHRKKNGFVFYYFIATSHIMLNKKRSCGQTIICLNVFDEKKKLNRTKKCTASFSL